ncbi:NitT/TauT family transport system permease protein [Breoghania corrubedonensis]|uniref:NitT/TauT family transport system permease protein n=1 Tax=Breoghania corrubedonensis TaxID=665038 RepID=A0A2T5V7V1_9HYPH|nr:NitT/TauT family transport system permease protein [Breoghania corrubedonensis]
MSTDLVADAFMEGEVSAQRRAGQWKALRSLGYAVAGMALLLVAWWIGGLLVENDPALVAFADFAPEPALARLVEMIASGEAWAMTVPSLGRVMEGLALAVAIGVPVGIAIGRVPVMREITNIPFQFLRMISPLSWMPIAVMAFATWDGAIVFLIMIAAVWPVLFSTAAGLKRVDPAWFRVARNLGARPWHMLFTIILPAISQDILTGIRLALGVAWIVLVPAEYLGVTSGLGYAINDARDTLEYDRLAATVVIIGVIGFVLDFACQQAISRLSWHRDD